MSSSKQTQDDLDSEPEMLAAEDALEEIPDDADGDIPMDSDEEDGEEINLSNDGIAYFEHHKDSVFAIAQHPTHPTLIATGGSEGDGDDAPGKGYVFDTAGRSFQVRRLVGGAHGDFSVVKVEFVKGHPHLLTSCGMDGVVRRWDIRGTTAGAATAAGQGASASAATAGLIKEWRGHRGDGEGGGVLGFVQGETGERVVTAGDDGVVLVFEA
ncbi:ribosome biogenesis protein Sqt1 [Magnaporthiopsis poae ATCC 64411]|uniref:Ribosome biogenesis protein Sqt1 n=1 Tax=Magnaporthiopsis poae (strain ATCC 64411 / 73-15) TaxID=644358 RepID=A0A0C4DRI9_MAGP6|nr:ribosome biogenesis protein Sqt1 [Magnaporthiopsis poae ATCC 64411]